MKASQFLRQSLVLLFLMVFVGGVVQEAKAQYFSFGKNRVQYNNFNWRYIQSEHFDVFYYQTKNYDLANFTAYALEASLQQLSEDFSHDIADRIQVIIYDSHNDFSQTNVVPLPVNAEGIGGVTDAYKNRITMPFSDNYQQFRNTLHHELEHAVLNDMFYGGNVQSRITGNALQIPDWYNEGMAEYTSLGWDTNTDMWIRDATINNYIPPVSRIGGGLFAYRGGQSIWNFIAEEYGRPKITEIMQALHTQRSMEIAFQRSLGLNLEEFSERWHDYYRERYLPEVANREDLSEFADLLTERDKSGTFNTSPAVSPQGDKIAMITNERGYNDVVVISAITGKKIKTLIKGEDNVNFEELNILNPNLSWSPDGEKLALSTKSKGSDNLAIVDYQTGKVRMIEFPKVDAIGSVAWAPDGNKIAFDGNIGPFQDIYVYNLKTREFNNITNDVISDYQPAWGADSETIYFVSHRGNEVRLNNVKNTSRLLLDNDLYSTDLYAVKIGSSTAQRLTKTPKWDEKQPVTSRDGKLFYISDENGIPNVYLMNLEDRTSSPLTDLQTGVLQISVSSDASRMAVNSINKGYSDIFMIRSPLTRKKSGSLEANHWAQRRAQESQGERVPATKYVQQMLTTLPLDETSLTSAVASMVDPIPKKAVKDTVTSTTTTAQDTTANTEARTEEEQDSDTIDFRNYVFDSSVEEDTVFANKYLDESQFDLKDNQTDDGRYVPKDYRLKFSTDLIYAGGNFSTTYGTYGITQIQFSDLLGNHQISFGTNLNLDLRNSTYFLQYAYLKNRTDWLFNFFHNSNNFQDYLGQLYRIRSYGGAINMRYPIDKFRRIDASLSMIGIAQDYSLAYADISNNQTTTFAYPQVIFTSDKTLPGFITPASGSRYSVSLTGSPPITGKTLQFVSLLGDYRKYFNLGNRYSFAVRGSGAASFGRDSQTFFMGGMLGWINQRWSSRSIPFEGGARFLTQPALPLRGHPFNSIYGDKFSLINAEFRFPLFAALLPGPIPILPLYNLTGVAFVDAGMAWGQDVVYEYPGPGGNTESVSFNNGDLDLRLSEKKFGAINTGNGTFTVPYNDGDILMGAGFGLRTIVFGFPLRYDVGWPYYRDGFENNPIHYISIGIDF